MARVLEHAGLLRTQVERSGPGPRPRVRILDGHFISQPAVGGPLVPFHEMQTGARSPVVVLCAEVRGVDDEQRDAARTGSAPSPIWSPENGLSPLGSSNYTKSGADREAGPGYDN